MTAKSLAVYYQARSLEHTRKVAEFAALCMDDQVRVATGKSLHCDAIALDIKWWPFVSALFDVVEDWLPCGKDGCFFYVREFGNSFVVRLSLLVLAVYIIVMALWWISIKQQTKRNKLLKYSMPKAGLESFQPALSLHQPMIDGQQQPYETENTKKKQ
jgi:hypothetical protein